MASSRKAIHTGQFGISSLGVTALYSPINLPCLLRMTVLPKNTCYDIASGVAASQPSKVIFSIKLPEAIAKELSSAEPAPLSLTFSARNIGQLTYGSTKSWSFLVTNEAGPVDLLSRVGNRLVGQGSVWAKMSVKNELEASKMLAIRSKSEQAEKDRRERKSIVLPEAVPKSRPEAQRKSVDKSHLGIHAHHPTAVLSTRTSKPASSQTLAIPAVSAARRSLSSASATTSDTRPRYPVSLIHLPEAAKQRLKRLMGNKRKKAQPPTTLPALAGAVRRNKPLGDNQDVPMILTASPAAESLAPIAAPAARAASGATMLRSSSGAEHLPDALLSQFKSLYRAYESAYAVLESNRAHFNELAARLQGARSVEDRQSIQSEIETAYAERGQCHADTERTYQRLHVELAALKEQILKEKFSHST